MGEDTFTDITWQKKQQIIASDLNKVIDNDDYIKAWRLGGSVRNVNPDTGEQIPELPFIDQGLAIMGGYQEISPPSPDFDGGTNDADRFTVQIEFPAGVFHPAYLPSVSLNAGSHTGDLARVEICIRTLTPLLMEFVFIKDTPTNFDSNDSYFITYIAMGVAGGATG